MFLGCHCCAYFMFCKAMTALFFVFDWDPVKIPCVSEPTSLILLLHMGLLQTVFPSRLDVEK